MYVDHTYLLAALCLVVNNLAECLAYRTHCDYDILSIGSTVVVKRTVLAADNCRYLIHIIRNDIGHCIVERVAALAMSEEHVRVLSHTAHYRTLRREGTIAEFLKSLLVNQRHQHFLIHNLYLLILVRSTETIEEINKRYARSKRSQMSNTREVHHFLNGTFSEHSETSLTARHHVLVVTENTERMRSERTSRNVEYARKELACDFIHVGDHQEKSLRCSKSGCEGTSLE